MIKYHMVLKNKQTNNRHICSMILKNDKYEFTCCKEIEESTLYDEKEILIFFAIDDTLYKLFDVYEVIYRDQPVEISIAIKQKQNIRNIK